MNTFCFVQLVNYKKVMSLKNKIGMTKKQSRVWGAFLYAQSVKLISSSGMNPHPHAQGPRSGGP